jgi:hypothetical protein
MDVFPTTLLPDGNVTFLFTDIDGSTALLIEHGDHYLELLVEHPSRDIRTLAQPAVIDPERWRTPVRG